MRRFLLLALLAVLAGQAAARPRTGRRTRGFVDPQLLDTPASINGGVRASAELLEATGDVGLTAAEFTAWRMEMETLLAEAGVSKYALQWDEVGNGVQPGEQAAEAAAPADAPPHAQLVNCINDAYDPHGINMTWSAAMTDETLGNFRAVGAWWTSAANDELASRIPLTISTTASVSRMPQVYAQCLSWGGPHSIVLYQPLLQKRAGRLSQVNRAILRAAMLKVRGVVARGSAAAPAWEGRAKVGLACISAPRERGLQPAARHARRVGVHCHWARFGLEVVACTAAPPAGHPVCRGHEIRAWRMSARCAARVRAVCG